MLYRQRLQTIFLYLYRRRCLSCVPRIVCPALLYDIFFFCESRYLLYILLFLCVVGLYTLLTPRLMRDLLIKLIRRTLLSPSHAHPSSHFFILLFNCNSYFKHFYRSALPVNPVEVYPTSFLFYFPPLENSGIIRLYLQSNCVLVVWIVKPNSSERHAYPSLSGIKLSPLGTTSGRHPLCTFKYTRLERIYDTFCFFCISFVATLFNEYFSAVFLSMCT